MKIMWNREKATRSVQNTVLRMIIAVLKWTLLTVVVIGKDKMKCGKVEVLHTFDADGEMFLQNYLALLAMQGKPLRPSKHGTISLRIQSGMTLLNIQINILSNLNSAAQVMPN